MGGHQILISEGVLSKDIPYVENEDRQDGDESREAQNRDAAVPELTALSGSPFCLAVEQALRFGISDLVHKRLKLVSPRLDSATSFVNALQSLGNLLGR